MLSMCNLAYHNSEQWIAEYAIWKKGHSDFFFFVNAFYFILFILSFFLIDSLIHNLKGHVTSNNVYWKKLHNNFRFFLWMHFIFKKRIFLIDYLIYNLKAHVTSNNVCWKKLHNNFFNFIIFIKFAISHT